MTSLIVSSFGPPVAIIGKSRSILRNALIIYTVFLPPDTLMILAPECNILSYNGSSVETTVKTIGISII